MSTVERRPHTLCFAGVIASCLTLGSTVGAESLVVVEGVEAQPLQPQVKRLLQALEFVGARLTKEHAAAWLRS